MFTSEDWYLKGLLENTVSPSTSQTPPPPTTHTHTHTHTHTLILCTHLTGNRNLFLFGVPKYSFEIEVREYAIATHIFYNRK